MYLHTRLLGARQQQLEQHRIGVSLAHGAAKRTLRIETVVVVVDVVVVVVVYLQ